MMEDEVMAKQKVYLGSYPFRGAFYSVEIPADDWPEARERLSAMSRGTIDGELMAILPARAGWLARLIVWWKNAGAAP